MLEKNILSQGLTCEGILSDEFYDSSKDAFEDVAIYSLFNT